MTTVDIQGLAFAGVARQARLVRDREVSPRELVALYLERIAELDPALNAFRVVLAEQAMAEAAHVERRLAAGEMLPLAGVPIAVKDDTDVAGISSMCGTGIDTGPVSSDSAAVRRLRAAGAVIIGKTHLPEFGAVPMCESPTWGVTRNPWRPNRTTGGSSGGSAAAVAAGMVPGALGTDGGGSVRIPAACCGVVGLKGQRGWISTKQSPERAYRFHGLHHIRNAGPQRRRRGAAARRDGRRRARRRDRLGVAGTSVDGRGGGPTAPAADRDVVQTGDSRAGQRGGAPAGVGNGRVAALARSRSR